MLCYLTCGREEFLRPKHHIGLDWKEAETELVIRRRPSGDIRRIMDLPMAYGPKQRPSRGRGYNSAESEHRDLLG